MEHKFAADTDATGNRQLQQVLGTLPKNEAETVRDWLSGGGGIGGGSADADPGAFLKNLASVGSDFTRPDPDDPQAVQHIGILGGGTAGYLAALALKAKRPWLDVTLVESKQIPVIGVGEATVSYMMMFLHHYLGIDPTELYEQVRPTWKLGIKFEWGQHPEGFMGPFDWQADSIGLHGALDTSGNINGSTLQSVLMMHDRCAVFDVDGKPVSLMKYLPFAYHLDNARFVAFLTTLAKERGVEHIEATLDDVALSGDEWVDHVRTTDGRQLRFDLYIDCTGFRSHLLGQALGTPFQSYGSSLFTDSAVTGNTPHDGHLRPYTTATTMNAGWLWRIPTPEDDHRGYVYSSAAISDDEAAAELAERCPDISEPKVVKFRSGRHEKAWRGNVIAVGNSYAFVEPLESSGLLMISVAVQQLVATLPASWSEPPVREVVNAGVAQQWDVIRWFLAIHYKFNKRLDTPFWKEARASTDISGFQYLLDMYANAAPLTRRHALVQEMLNRVTPTFFGLQGIDYMLLGQQVPTRLVPADEPIERWHARRAAAESLAGKALPQRDGLEAFHQHPEFNVELLTSFDSWAGPHVAGFMGMT